MSAPDLARARAFSDRMLSVVNQAFLGLAIGVGHERGLFEVMRGLPPAPCAAIARAARVDERTVREWLAAMVAGGVVELDGTRGLYQLPPEHAAWIARAGDLAPLLGSLSALAAAGWPERMDQLEADARARRAPAVLSLVAGLPDRLAAGIDVLWIGPSWQEAATRYPASRFTGERGRPADLVAALECLHRQETPGALLADARRALRPGGLLICAGVAASSHLSDNLDHPLAAALYAMSMLRAPAAGAGGVWGEERAREAILAAGFADLEVRRLDDDLVHDYYIARAPG